ncbi:CDP-alcohol phosphatidyltransferase [Tieghemostelium lacteum]|uniref:CDP-alcohol phosphatidyltransferase n=1 Tax=Tieghemostelium lacteum TaxID=361077 RepID=A0A152A803_TIELA|nr:CDP-alcohol phosphatidyltransferase [Tieghemostelium lacteum]|eukprot:KYR02363.1 CDP-alcohol phosphatidyltransferase [Tieghemostelium lacteum]
MKLSEKSLFNLSKHKYSGIDDSLLAKYVLQKYWNFALKFLPLNIAPNLVTLTGTIAIVVTFLIVAYYSPFLTGTLPTWLYVLCGLSLFFYQTMDNLDGKQARRTNSSSALGQLFDHGCDSLVCMFQSLSQASVGQYGTGSLALVQLFIATFLPFWMATWEEYHTGTLHLGKFNGPDEGIIIIVLSCFVTAYFGGDIWVQKLSYFIPKSQESMWISILPQGLLQLQLNQLTVSLLAIPCIITCYFNIQNVVKHLRAKNQPIFPAIKHILVWVLVFTFSLSWYYTSTSFYNLSSVWHQYPRTTQYTIGIIFGELVSRLIIAHMCHDSYAIIQKPIIPLILISIFSNLTFYLQRELVPEYILLFIFTIYCSIQYSLFVRDIVKQLCAFLKIKCFSIAKQH